MCIFGLLSGYCFPFPSFVIRRIALEWYALEKVMQFWHSNQNEDAFANFIPFVEMEENIAARHFEAPSVADIMYSFLDQTRIENGVNLLICNFLQICSTFPAKSNTSTRHGVFGCYDSSTTGTKLNRQIQPM